MGTYCDEFICFWYAPFLRKVTRSVRAEMVTILSIFRIDTIQESRNGFFRRETLPAANLYFPMGHPVHVPPLGPVYPASHVQSESWELSAGELELEPHDVIETPPVQYVGRGTAVEYLPGPQSLQASAPGPVL